MKPMNFDFQSRRSMVLARRGMVAASNPLASQAGLQILREGGNAADAAIAAAAVMNVTAPASTGIGGDCFVLYYNAKTKTISALNGSGRAPAAITLDHFKAKGYTEIPERSADAVTVPGAVQGWEDVLTRHGTMDFKTVLRDAIHYASEGYVVSPVFGTGWSRDTTEAFLKKSPNTEDYLPSGKSPQVGQVVQLQGLARTFQQIADGGAQAFYQGDPAKAIIETLQPLGSLMTLDDLKNHQSTWEDPITTNYRGIDVYECPPNGQGLTALIALNILEHDDLASLPWDSPERLHRMVEAMRLAFADARHYIADPVTDPAPLTDLLSKPYAKQRHAMISNAAAMQPPSYGQAFGGSDTIYLTTMDSQGNACSFINSLYMGFGSGIVAKGTGIFLQNRGANFTLEDGHPNVIAGGKRPYHTIIPGMALKDGDLWASFGVMGGFMQPQGHVQVLTAMIDDDLNPQDALDRSRFCLLDGTSDSTLALEDGIPLKTMARLAELGHTVKPLVGTNRAWFGSGQIIRYVDGVMLGGSDPRKDGLVAAF